MLRYATSSHQSALNKRKGYRMDNNNFYSTYTFGTEVDPAMGIDRSDTYKQKRKEYQLIVSLLEAMERQNGIAKATL